MRVLVTGGAGFLGRRFAHAHLDAGDTVEVWDDLSNPESKPYFRELEKRIGKLSDSWIEQTDVRKRLGSYMGGSFDLAYHFAAPVGGRTKIEGDPMYNAESLEIDAAFFRWATAGGCWQIVYPSSSAVYPTILQDTKHSGALQEGDLYFKNGQAWYPPDEMYGFTKLAGEYLAWKAAAYGVNTLCIRPFSGYGEGQSFAYPIPSIAGRVLRRENPLTIWGSGAQTRDFIHVDDIVRLTRKRLGQGVDDYQTLNLGSGVATTFYEIARLMAEIVGYEPVIVSDETKPEGVYRRYADIARQRKVSDEPLISLREGLTRVLADVEQRMSVTVGGM